MNTQDFKRKLTAVFSADVAGYSRLMGEDEAATVKTLETYKQVMFSLIKQHRGRVIDSPGDNLLAEFASVVDAVQCGVAAQNEFKVRNANLQENRRMQFRIGINLGDVIEEGERIYGDGVNIAARLEGLADPGGICVSKTAFDHIESKLPLGYQFLGLQTVKNIAKPVGAYKVLMEPRVIDGEQEEEAKTGQPYKPPPLLPDKPSIAVLPFTNMSGDPGQEYIADGITENIIANLSKISEMFVIARNSTFIYKGKPVKVQEVGRNLGVRYILEGSVQKASERVRITAQLVDATTGHHLWAERYDRSIEDFFALQDEITHEIVVALQVELTDGERARTYRRTNSLEAWGYLVQALGYFNRFTREDNDKARTLAEEAIKRDPNYAYAWAFLGWIHIMDAGFGAQSSTSQHFKKAVALAEKTVAVDDSIAEAHSLLSYIRLFQRDYDTALLEGAKAVALAPSDSYSHGIFAHTMLFSGDFDGAIKMVCKAMRLSPYYPDWYLQILANAYYMNEQYEQAIEAWERQHMLMRQRGLSERRLIVGHVGLASCYVRLGQLDHAKRHSKEVLRLNPNFTLENMHKLNPFKNPRHLENIVDPLRKTGLK